jgi:hypothetical protein
MKKTILLFITLIVTTFLGELMAQTVTIDGVFKPRFENRHGYQTLFPEQDQAANFISQRSRLNLRFANENFKVGFSVQNVGVWGETGTLRKSDVNGTMIYEAWGEILVSEKFSIKAGRQEIIYDDHRIFGNVDWAQQGRSHDALLIKFKPREECSLDIGFAYNAMGESLTKVPYMQNNYKTFQYFHWHRSFGDFTASLLFLNNGMPWMNPEDTLDNGNAKENVAYSQTMGTRITYQKEKFSANAAVYYQMGKRTLLDIPVDNLGNTKDSTMKVGAIYFALDAAFQVVENFSVGLGLEYLSGNDEKEMSDNNGVQEKEKSFSPFYGTNHKFNGWMDYFYVGNHFGSVGLLDIYVPLKFKKDKFSAALIPHFFSTAGTLYHPEKDDEFNNLAEMKEYSKGLGTEIDFTVGYAFTKAVGIHAGYSMMFASETMEVLKGTQANVGNTWGWVMFIFKPTFYKSN